MLQRVSIVLLLSLFGCLPLFAQTTEPSVSANVLRNKVAIGEFGTLIIEVINGDAQMPARIDTPGLEIIGSGNQFTQKITNGRRIAKVSYYYRFKGDNPGEFTIPPLSIDVKGKRLVNPAIPTTGNPLVTPAIPITIFERSLDDVTRDATKPYFGKLELVKDTFYVNELIPFSLTAYVKGRNAINEVVNPKLTNEAFVFRGFREVRTDGGDLGNSNSYFSSAVLPSNLFALKAGSHRLGPAQIGVRILDANGGGFGLSAFFQRSVTREMATNTVNVTVKSLPNGEPISFNGGVGSFEMTAIPSTRTVAVGDPISMEFEITGVGNLRTMSSPIFSTPQKGIWKTYEASKTFNEEDDSDGFKAGRVQFSMVIIPEAIVSTIPPFEFSFFDPTEETYVTRKSEPIPVSIIKGRSDEEPTVIQFSNTGGSNSSDSAFSSAQSPTPEFNGMLHISTGEPRWIAKSKIGKHSGLYYGAQAVFSIVFFTIVGFGVMRLIQDGKFQKQSDTGPATFTQALKRIPKTGSTKHDFFQSVNTALALWKSEHTNPPPELEAIVARIKTRSDSVLYSGYLSPQEPVGPAEVSEFCNILEKLPRR